MEKENRKKLILTPWDYIQELTSEIIVVKANSIKSKHII